MRFLFKNPKPRATCPKVAFYSPRRLAKKVNMRDIALPGVLVPRKQRPSKKKSNGKMKVELNDRHTACYGKDKFLMNMLRAAVVPSSSWYIVSMNEHWSKRSVNINTDAPIVSKVLRWQWNVYGWRGVWGTEPSPRKISLSAPSDFWQCGIQIQQKNYHPVEFWRGGSHILL